MRKTVGIIGAGISGISSVKCCLEAGLLPTCFEQEGNIGGQWNVDSKQCVPLSTITNTSKEMTCFSDFPMPKEYPNFLTVPKLMAYIQCYVEKFGIKEHIKLKHTVIR